MRIADCDGDIIENIFESNQEELILRINIGQDQTWFADNFDHGWKCDSDFFTGTRLKSGPEMFFFVMLYFFMYKWYFVSKIVLTNWEKNGSRDREKLLKFEAKGQEFANFLIYYSNSESSVQFLKQNAFLTYSWMFIRSNKLKQLEFKL